MAFDPDKFLEDTAPAPEEEKKQFDPDAFLRMERAKDDPGTLEAMKEGALEAVTFGFAPEITARARSIFGDVSYEDALKEERLETETAKEKRPGAFTTGEVAATVGSLAVPGGLAIKGAVKGAKAVSKAAKASKVGQKVASVAKSPEVRKKVVEGAKEMVAEVGIEAATGLPGIGISIKAIKALLKKGKITKKTYDKMMKTAEKAEKAKKTAKTVRKGKSGAGSRKAAKSRGN